MEEGATTTRKLMKLELTEKLMELSVLTKGKLLDLQRAAMEQGIPIEETTVKVKEGWAQKQKGLLQVLWEHGFIDTSKNIKSYYTINGIKNTPPGSAPPLFMRLLMLPHTCIGNGEREVCTIRPA